MLFPKYNNKVIRFELQDTASKQKYISLINLFYKDAHIILLVYDITNQKSFKEIENFLISTNKKIFSKKYK